MRDKYIFIATQDRLSADGHQACAHIINCFTLDKTETKRWADDAEAVCKQKLRQMRIPPYDPNKSSPFALVNKIHGVLYGYEIAHLQGAGNWDKFKGFLKRRIPSLDIKELQRRNQPVVAHLAILNTRGERETVGTVYLNDERFIAIAPQPGGDLINEVYYRRGDIGTADNMPPRHYIRLDKSQTYVKRFVTRYLNGCDAMFLAMGYSLLSTINGSYAQPGEVQYPNDNKTCGRHPCRVADRLTESEQILSHTRGWGGNKRYISTTVTPRYIPSSRGVDFRGMFGAVTVDLAKVPNAHIYDLHRPDTAAQHYGLFAEEILHLGHHPGERGYTQEKYLGLRDVLRTRELLIKEEIPYDALRFNQLGRVLVGIGSQNEEEHLHAQQTFDGVLRAHVENIDQVMYEEGFHRGVHPVVSYEAAPFKERLTDKRWIFIEFRSERIADLIARYLAESLENSEEDRRTKRRKGAEGTGIQPVVQLHKYSPVRVRGM